MFKIMSASQREAWIGTMAFPAAMLIEHATFYNQAS